MSALIGEEVHERCDKGAGRAVAFRSSHARIRRASRDDRRAPWRYTVFASGVRSLCTPPRFPRRDVATPRQTVLSRA